MRELNLGERRHGEVVRRIYLSGTSVHMVRRWRMDLSRSFAGGRSTRSTVPPPAVEGVRGSREPLTPSPMRAECCG